MTQKDKFSADNWSQVLEAPLLAGFAVTAADPGGLISAVQESAATAGALRDASQEGGAGTLAHDIAEAYKTKEGRKAARDGVKAVVKGKNLADASAAAVARLGETAALVRQTAPDQADAFVAFLLETANRTAEASTEGGFLGFGGETVSEAERKTLLDLETTLKGVA